MQVGQSGCEPCFLPNFMRMERFEQVADTSANGTTNVYILRRAPIGYLSGELLPSRCL